MIRRSFPNERPMSWRETTAATCSSSAECPPRNPQRQGKICRGQICALRLTWLSFNMRSASKSIEKTIENGEVCRVDV